MTQLPGTEMEAPQETAAEASENMGSKGFSGRDSWHPKVLHTAENPQSMEKKVSYALWRDGFKQPKKENKLMPT